MPGVRGQCRSQVAHGVSYLEGIVREVAPVSATLRLLSVDGGAGSRAGPAPRHASAAAAGSR